MILVDTSIWADHIRVSDLVLSELLERGSVLTHPFVIEELACGNLPLRGEYLRMLHQLPQAPVASHHEVIDLIARSKLYGTGVGSVDVHLIASALLAGAKILSKDKALVREALRLGVSI